jgi:hypothetical protein
VQVQEHRISEASRQVVERQRELEFRGRRREGMREALQSLEERRPTLAPAQRAENEEKPRFGSGIPMRRPPSYLNRVVGPTSTPGWTTWSVR